MKKGHLSGPSFHEAGDKTCRLNVNSVPHVYSVFLPVQQIYHACNGIET
jgi:hypothetical protein